MSHSWLDPRAGHRREIWNRNEIWSLPNNSALMLACFLINAPCYFRYRQQESLGDRDSELPAPLCDFFALLHFLRWGCRSVVQTVCELTAINLPKLPACQGKALPNSQPSVLHIKSIMSQISTALRISIEASSFIKSAKAAFFPMHI